MAALDDPDLRARLLTHVPLQGVRGACMAVGISRTSLARYVKRNPDFRGEIERVKAAPAAPRPRRPAPPRVVQAQVLDLRPGKRSADLGDLEFDPDDDRAFRVVSAKMLMDKDEHPLIRRTCHAYLAAHHLARSSGEAASEAVYVELPAKDATA